MNWSKIQFTILINKVKCITLMQFSSLTTDTHHLSPESTNTVPSSQTWTEPKIMQHWAFYSKHLSITHRVWHNSRIKSRKWSEMHLLRYTLLAYVIFVTSNMNILQPKVSLLKDITLEYASSMKSAGNVRS
jgi:hypothetical protein